MSFDPLLDLDDANSFLSMILATMPATDRPVNPWDLLEPQLATLNLDFHQNGLDMLNKPLMNFDITEFSNSRPFENGDGLSLYSRGSLSELADGSTPNTLVLLPRSAVDTKQTFSPVSMKRDEVSPPCIKREGEIYVAPAVPVKPEVISPCSLKADGDATPPETEAPLPGRVRALSKDKVAKPAAGGRRIKTLHNMIEKKYRTNINLKILELRDAVPTLRVVAGSHSVTSAELDGLLPALKLNKASVLTKAREYILHLERKNRQLGEQVMHLQQLTADGPKNGSVSAPLFMDDFAAADMALGLSGMSLNDPLFADSMQPSPQQQNSVNNFANHMQQNVLSLQSLQSPQMRLAAGAGGVPNQQYSQNQPVYAADNNFGMMMGGVALMLGGSLLDSDSFRGMAALPLVPAMLRSAPPAMLEPTFQLFRLGVVALGVLMFVSALLNMLPKNKEKQLVRNAWVKWGLRAAGMLPARPLLAEDRARVIGHLSGVTKPSAAVWRNDYAVLCGAELTFELCFLAVLVGELLRLSSPIYGSLPGLAWRTEMLLTLPADSLPETGRMHTLVQKIDNAAMFRSVAFMRRVANVSMLRAINTSIEEDADDNELYEQLVRVYASDFYGLLFSMRATSLLHEMNEAFLEIVACDAKEDREAQIARDLAKLEKLVDPSSPVHHKVDLCKCLVQPTYASKLLAQHRAANGETDDMLSLDSDDTADFDDGTFDQDESTALPTMSVESFVTYVTAVIVLVWLKDRAKAVSLLQHLNLDIEVSKMSLVHFTSLARLFQCVIVTANGADAHDDANADADARLALTAAQCAVLERLVKTCKHWLDHDAGHPLLSYKLRGELADMVTAKGLALDEM